jgi:2-amino-4-hydroxy-6-hydroxymethyldihydropteridine diphosphokinase/dihydropteroate synthase
MIYLSLGTNLEPRREYLREAKQALITQGYKIIAASAIYETPALLPMHATNDWQKNFLNQVIAVETDKLPSRILSDSKQIEKDFGRKFELKWSPRPIDIDILLYHQHEVQTDDLVIPHPGLKDRNFFISPLLEVAKMLNDLVTCSRFQPIYNDIKPKLPRWMYILNLTPDSFANDRGIRDYIKEATSALMHGAHILDIGAESTRPQASPLTSDEEWQRLQEFLPNLISLAHSFEAKVSIDTYHPETMQKAIDLGVDYINDVSGLGSEQAKDIFKHSNVGWIAMHNLGLPANPMHVLPKTVPAYKQVIEWVQSLDISDTDRRRLIIDPGIGFGKDAVQSRDILSNISQFKQLGYTVLIGHSRKSFLSGITNQEFKDRDLETIGVSLRLMTEGVDILRIHNMEAHKRAVLSYNV